MLKANELVATHLTEQGKGLTYRIHEEPAEENIKDFATLARSFGFDLKDKPTNAELQKFFDEAFKTPYGQYLATSYIRRMRMAIYSPENLGHYGLGLSHYCHFTSPIRRYVDLVVHRILFEKDEEDKSLEMIAKDCSEQERISAKAEGSVVLLKKLRLLSSLQKSDPYKEYDAVVTRVKSFGFSFEVMEYMIEGFLHVSELEQDYFLFDEKKMMLRGRHHGITYSSGDRIQVILKDVDFITQNSQWYLSAKKVRSLPKSKKQHTKKEKKIRKDKKRSKRKK